MISHMDPLKLTIEGDPVPALRAKAQVKQTRDGKAFAHIYTPTANGRYADRVRFELAQQHPELPVPAFAPGSPVAMRVRFVFSRPQSHYGTGRNAGVLKATAPHWHTVKPDMDNLLKLLWDALTPRLFAGDQQIARLEDPEKVYVEPGELPRTELVVWALDEPARALALPEPQSQLALVA